MKNLPHQEKQPKSLGSLSMETFSYTELIRFTRHFTYYNNIDKSFMNPQYALRIL